MNHYLCLHVFITIQQMAAEHRHIPGARVHRVHYDTDSLHQSLSTSALHNFSIWWLKSTKVD